MPSWWDQPPPDPWRPDPTYFNNIPGDVPSAWSDYEGKYSFLPTTPAPPVPVEIPVRTPIPPPTIETQIATKAAQLTKAGALGRLLGWLGIGLTLKELLDLYEEWEQAELELEMQATYENELKRRQKRRAEENDLETLPQMPPQPIFFPPPGKPSRSDEPLEVIAPPIYLPVPSTRPVQSPLELPQPAPLGIPTPTPPAPIPVTAPEAPTLPQPGPDLVPIPAPSTQPQPAPSPAPVPSPQPSPIPTPTPRPAPAPTRFPWPFRYPLPIPLGIPVPQPIPRYLTPVEPSMPPLPTPTPTPTPTPVPMPMSQPQPTPGQAGKDECQVVKRRRRRKNRCREGFFSEFPGETQFINWREVDCETRKPIKKDKDKVKARVKQESVNALRRIVGV